MGVDGAWTCCMKIRCDGLALHFSGISALPEHCMWSGSYIAGQAEKAGEAEGSDGIT